MVGEYVLEPGRRIPRPRADVATHKPDARRLPLREDARTNSDATTPGNTGKHARAPRVVSRPQGECDMRVPQVSERIKEAPAQALRGVFAGIGQLLLITDKLRHKTPAYHSV